MEHNPDLGVHSPGQSFARFYRDQFPLVVSYLMKFGADRAEAEDAVQSAMELLLRHPDNVRSPAAWVRVVARNNWMRAMRRHVTVAPTAEACDRAEPGHVDAIGQFAEREDAVRIIRSLPRTQREILTLVLCGYRPAEIAELTGRNAAAVRSSLAHARRRLGCLLPDRPRLPAAA
jgi:RNA polymerase sigma factor (sigma-70 family)